MRWIDMNPLKIHSYLGDGDSPLEMSFFYWAKAFAGLGWYFLYNDIIFTFVGKSQMKELKNVIIVTVDFVVEYVMRNTFLKSFRLFQDFRTNRQKLKLY